MQIYLNPIIKKLFSLTAILFTTSVLFTGSAVASSPKTDSGKKATKVEFGEKITMSEAVDLGTALKNYKAKKADTQLVVGEVVKVCKSKGCWMALKNDKGTVRVTFSGYSFFVPYSLVGKTVLVQGKLNEKKMSLEETKHYVKDDGGDPSKITEPAVEYRFVATGVKVKS